MLCNNGQSVIENAVSNKRRIEDSFHLSNENRKYAVAAFEVIKRGFKGVSQYCDIDSKKPSWLIQMNGKINANVITNIRNT